MTTGVTIRRLKTALSGGGPFFRPPAQHKRAGEYVHLQEQQRVTVSRLSVCVEQRAPNAGTLGAHPLFSFPDQLTSRAVSSCAALLPFRLFPVEAAQTSPKRCRALRSDEFKVARFRIDDDEPPTISRTTESPRRPSKQHPTRDPLEADHTTRRRVAGRV